MLHVDKDQMTEEESAYAKAVGAILDEAKEEAGLSFTDLASMTELSRAHLTRIFYGTIDVRIADLRRICKVFEIDPMEVLEKAAGK